MPCLAPSLAPAHRLLPSSWWRDEPGMEPDTPWSQAGRLMVVAGWAADRGVGGPPCRVWHRALAPAQPLLLPWLPLDEPRTEPDTPWSQVGHLLVASGLCCLFVTECRMSRDRCPAPCQTPCR